MTAHLSGSCCCGTIRYHVDSHPRHIVNCHCNLCRTMNGSAFSSYVVIPHNALTVSGEEHAAHYPVTEGARKHFCRNCGTPLFNVNNRYPGVCMLYLGTLADGVRHIPSVNLYCDSMLAWVPDIGSATRIQQGF